MKQLNEWLKILNAESPDSYRAKKKKEDEEDPGICLTWKKF